MKLVNIEVIKDELERLIRNYRFYSSTEAKYRYEAYKELSEWIDGLEVEEVDLEKEIETHLKDCLDVKFPTTDIELIKKDVAYTAKKFFELGMSVSKQAMKDE